ncbi:pre protein translocase subunit SecA [Tribonema minus]|uniref:Protein translocase subunit SecA n=1 Tax=Tribonema minus TaxID=303371 RepID=A0A835ZJ09_9STRA|nr:pre protein translocase subunit SecA [Tribonema minus]
MGRPHRHTCQRLRAVAALSLLYACRGFVVPAPGARAASPRRSLAASGTSAAVSRGFSHAVSNVHAERGSRSLLSMGLLDNFMKPADAPSSFETKQLKQYNERVARINALEDSIETLSDEELRAKTAEFRARLAAGTEDTLDDILEEAFAVVREAAWRVLELRHYDVQLVGGLVLHECKLAEMATGEGKTLVATLPSYLNALSGAGGVFVVTANDYLARRDAETMGQVHRFLGLTVGLVQAEMDTAARRAAYACDVTYVTNQELGFDYLRDNLAVSEAGVAQVKPFHYCLVDEADSILIDEARTPLIISKQVPAPKQKFALAAKISGILKKGMHYDVKEKEQMVIMTDRGFADTQKMLGKSMFDAADAWAPYIINSLKAKELFAKDKEYIVKDGQVQIVDSFSGRVLEGRRYSDGLHQSLEAKEGLEVSTQGKITAQVTYQSLFRSFPRLAGMSGTAATDAREFENTYGLLVLRIPTALPLARRDYPDAVYRTRDASLRALLGEVERQHEEEGRPILIGTTSVEMSELIAKELQERGVKCEVLNAKPGSVEREAEIVAQAGRKGRVTVATNMAGRGTDIILGGSPAVMARLRLRAALAERHLEAAERAALPAPADSFYPCALSDGAAAALEAAVAAAAADAPLSRGALEALVARASESAPVEDAVTKAARKAAALIKSEYAAALKEEGETVRAAGGLYVMGTSRHESRRIDNQLRGRSGRQGDPGASRFFLSLDDDLFRVFGADKAKGIMNAFRLSDDMPIESKAVSETLGRVQQAAEDYFASIRRSVFDYDEVLNAQRNALYRTRGAFLRAPPADADALVLKYCAETVADIVPNFLGAKADPAGLAAKMRQFFPTAPAEMLAEEKLKGGDGAVRAQCEAAAAAAWRAKRDELDQVRPGPGLETARYLTLTQLDDLWIKSSYIPSTSTPPPQVRPGLGLETARYLTLTQLDDLWCDHLDRMNLLKESVSMEVFRGNDPLQEFKDQGRELFKDLLATARRNAVYSLFIYNPRPAAEAGAAAAAAQ